jgi:hypothetical protein
LVSEYFNGLRELITREDGAEKLLAKMQGQPIETDARSVDYGSIMQGMYLDILLAQPEFMNSLSESQIEAVDMTAAARAEAQLEQTEIYGGSAGLFYQAFNEKIEPYTSLTTINTPNGKIGVLATKWE